MPSLQDLPNELLIHILSSIGENTPPPEHLLATDDDHDEEVDLQNLCLVSRTLCEAAQPFLYRSFYTDGLLDRLSSVISFARTICQRPDLAKHVKDLSIVPCEAHTTRCLPYGTSLKVEEKALFKSAIQDLDLGDQEQIWIQGMEETDLDIFTAILVAKTPNLSDLSLAAGRSSILKAFDNLFDRTPLFLSGLKSFSIECEDMFTAYSIRQYEKLLTLPKLKTAHFELGDLNGDSFPSSWSPGALALENIIFSQCHIDAGALQKLMQACRGLKLFNYMNFEDIRELERHISSHVNIGSFREFSALKKIQISHAICPLHPELPRCIKEFTIDDCELSFRKEIRNIAKDCRKKLYPDFVKFKVLTSDVSQPIMLPGQRIPDKGTPQEIFIQHQQLFQPSNVDFQIYPYKMLDLDDPDLDSDMDEDFDDYEDYDGEDWYDDIEQGPEGLVRHMQRTGMGPMDIIRSMNRHRADGSVIPPWEEE
ncbi:hypothetical protein N7481_008898 [Penicillium waksmanii]|uniref:uncharacterized protein n=1 Tax=Penicillium waksmanii TaxID=69791 RepID=UPI0025492A8D|nr:uncharacterized protein N7481_008898 [Penicillium waksmanii]KAJ5975191.1 hypothetical protein N7481_008898 [Penicillium waksmanii]